MSGNARFERALPEILEDLGAGPTPDYTELLLARTAATSQRPGWMIPERWYSMSAISERFTTAPRIPMRTIGVVALLILVLVAAGIDRRRPTASAAASIRPGRQRPHGLRVRVGHLRRRPGDAAICDGSLRARRWMDFPDTRRTGRRSRSCGPRPATRYWPVT